MMKGYSKKVGTNDAFLKYYWENSRVGEENLRQRLLFENADSKWKKRNLIKLMIFKN